MTNKQLVDCVADKAGLTKKAADEAVKAVFEVIQEALTAKEDVKDKTSKDVEQELLRILKKHSLIKEQENV